MRRRAVASLLAAILTVVAVAGCARGPKLIDVWGTVTFNDQPIPRGMIFFDPDPIKGNGGPGGYASIEDGSYDTRDRGRGVIPGPHTARIYAYDGKPDAHLPMGKQLVPQYTEQVQLVSEHTPTDIQLPVPTTRPNR